MHKIVHLDLKGAPLKVDYLSRVFHRIKTWGATGVLLEWEDTFPYKLNLKDIGSQNGVLGSGGDGLYSPEDVQRIFKLAKENFLEAIQLIQTIGHMEFVLKHPSLRVLREVENSPAVLCPSRPEALQLVTIMLEQALHIQPDATFIHIGADEVWHSAVCEKCQRRSANNEHKAASLYLEHIQSVVLFLKQKNPNLTVLMWEDMLRTMNVDVIRHYRLSDLVQPVVWHYNPKECFQLEPMMWDTYKQIFPHVWIGSAFKGANGGCQVLSPVARYISNHEGWLCEIGKYSTKINFVGIILTGWSRFDHFATLCELFPVSLPSLKCCLQILKTPTKFSEGAISEVIPDEEWPGVELARCVHSFVILRERCLAFIHGDIYVKFANTHRGRVVNNALLLRPEEAFAQLWDNLKIGYLTLKFLDQSWKIKDFVFIYLSHIVATWLNPWQIRNEYTNPLQIENIVGTTNRLQMELLALEQQTSVHLHAITGKRSAEEWLGTFIAPLVRQITDIHETALSRFKSDASVQPKCISDCKME